MQGLPQTPRERRHAVIAACLLVAVTAGIYGQVLGHAFVDYDDNTYVTQNPRVQMGLTREGIAWAFTSFSEANWHPLTWLSHMLDCTLFGVNPRGHHATSLALHIANTLLLFIILHHATRAPWRSAFAAALFACHPLHVESVAWVAERKDVLSAFLGLLAIREYQAYAEKPSVWRYLLVFIFLALGLTAKPMLVTLPAVLLLLDVWPLRRLDLSGASPAGAARRIGVLTVEKAPLFALSAASSLLTILAQSHGGAMKSFQAFSLQTRVANALISYVAYIGKTVYPTRLAVFYPHPGGGVSPVYAAAAGALLLLVSLLALRWVRRRPHLLVGWLWYLVMLLPVIGIVQVGSQAMADRYTYLPLIGLSIMLAWAIPDRLLERRWPRRSLAVAAVMLIAALSAGAWRQVGYWHDGEALFAHALAVTTNNAVAESGLGDALLKKHEVDKAVEHFRAALEIAPNLGDAHNNLGVALCEQGKVTEGIEHIETALRLEPNQANWAYNLASAFAKAAERDKAIEMYRRALELEPNLFEAHNDLGTALLNAGKYIEAERHFIQAVALHPDSAPAHNNLGAALARQHKAEAAANQFLEAIHLDPDSSLAHINLGALMARQGNTALAEEHLREAIRIDPELVEPRVRLATLYLEQGQAAEAETLLNEAVRLEPGDITVYNLLAEALTKQGRPEEAVAWLEEVLLVNPRQANAHYNLGIALEELGRHDEAREHLEAALDLRPDWSDVADMLNQPDPAAETSAPLDRPATGPAE